MRTNAKCFPVQSIEGESDSAGASAYCNRTAKTLPHGCDLPHTSNRTAKTLRHGCDLRHRSNGMPDGDCPDASVWPENLASRLRSAEASCYASDYRLDCLCLGLIQRLIIESASLHAPKPVFGGASATRHSAHLADTRAAGIAAWCCRRQTRVCRYAPV